jgi:enoyl-CoA hydratase/carnithine racemase
VDAVRAVEVELATRVVGDAELVQVATDLALQLASGPTMAYGSTKILLSRELDMDLGSSIELEAFTQALLMTSEDHAEFYEAFTAKRQPDWKGK